MKLAIVRLAALAQPTRLTVFRLLVQAGPAGLHAGEIGQRLSLPPPTLSFHLKELVHAGLLRGHSEGRYIRYAAEFAAMDALLGYLTENCCGGYECEVTPSRSCTGVTS